MLYMPLQVRNPFFARTFEALHCLLALYILTFLMTKFEQDFKRSHAYLVIISLDACCLLYDLSYYYSAFYAWVLGAVGGGRVLGRRRVIPPGWWAWCTPANEDSIQETLGIDFKVFAFALSGILAKALSPAPAPATPYKGQPNVGSEFDLHLCILFIGTTRMLGSVVMLALVNILIPVMNWMGV